MLNQKFSIWTFPTSTKFLYVMRSKLLYLINDSENTSLKMFKSESSFQFCVLLNWSEVIFTEEFLPAWVHIAKILHSWVHIAIIFHSWVHIAIFLHSWVQKNDYVHSQNKKEKMQKLMSAHNHFFALMSTKKWLCALMSECT